MNMPVWDLPFAHGLLIAIVANLHVFVSHFAIGGGLYLVVMEHVARRHQDLGLLSTLERHSRFFMLLTLVFGAISGVGIWFTIALINPAGTSALIRAFVWGWAIEWTFFVAEIAAAMAYYYGWKKLSPAKHLAVGWIYFANAWLSMVVINGILSFQLTPGTWLETRSFWDGFFNPTYWSSLAARTFFAIALGGLFALWSAAKPASVTEQERRPWILRVSGIWAIVGLALTAACTVWWWNDLPEEIRSLANGDMPIATVVTTWTPVFAAILAGLIFVGPILMPKIVNRPVAAVVLLAGLFTMSGGEWAREALRKPWVIYDYMYSNGILADEVETLREEGVVANAKWIDPTVADGSDPVALGEQLFRVTCQNCHARSGYNGLTERTAQWDEEFAGQMVYRIENMRRLMPPWVGTEDEADALGSYLVSLQDSPAAELTDGRALYDVRCSPCHSLGEGDRPLSEYVEGLTFEDLDEYMQDMGSDYMPDFTGTDAERELLAQWLADNVAVAPEEEVSR